MRIQSISINNYRSFGTEANCLQVNPGVTTIVGMNGAGKSNLIDIIGTIDLVKGIDTHEWRQYRNRINDLPVSLTVRLARLGTEDPSIYGNDVTVFTFQEDGSYSISGGIADIFELQLHRYENVLSIIERTPVVNTGEKNNILVKAKNIQNFSRCPLKSTRDQFNSIIAYLDKYIQDEENKIEMIEYCNSLIRYIESIINSLPVFFRHQDKKQLKNSYSIDELRPLNNSNGGISLDSKPNDLFLSLLDIADIRREDIINAMEKESYPAKAMLENKARPQLEKVMVKFRQFYKKDSESLLLTFRIEGKTLFVTFTSGNNSTSFSERSNGLKWYFNMFVDMMHCTDDNRPVVYVLDEPGIHLHINAQDELKRLFIEQALAGSQIIYTTHSPYMIDNNLGCIRGIVKTQGDEFSCIFNSLYNQKFFENRCLDTLSPVAAAMGMDYKLMPGISPYKYNIIVEGITDQIYLNAMAKILNVDMDNISIIPSTGAQNIKHLCSILIGWGLKFLVVFDFDNEGVRCGADIEKELNLQYNKNFIFLKEINEEDYRGLVKIEPEDSIVIESLLSRANRERFGIEEHATQAQKKVLAVRFASAIDNPQGIDEKTQIAFSNLFGRILSCIQHD